MAGGFRRTAAFERAVGVTALLALLAMVLRRVDLVVLAVPFALGTALALARRPATGPRARFAVGAPALLEGDPVTVTVAVSAAEPLDIVVATVRHGPGLYPDGWPAAEAIGMANMTVMTAMAGVAGVAGVAAPARATYLRARGHADLRVRLSATRWGRAAVGPVVVIAVAAQGLLVAEPVFLPVRYVPVWPLREVFGATDVVPRAAGMVGAHRSRRPGEGTDIAEVRLFQAGDRLRRINWRVSLRQGRPHVTATVSDRDTDVALCLDTRHEMPGTEGTSLDLTVRAAAAVGEHYLRTGDRVALVDLGQPMRRVRAGAGRAHLVRLLDVLLDVRGDRRGDDTTATLALADVAPGALVVVLSPLVGEEAFGTVTRLARTGRAVVVVDTLPRDSGPGEYGSWTTLAWRVWRLDRENGVGRLGELGVPVVPWRGSGSLDEVLRDVSRAARAPRILR